MTVKEALAVSQSFLDGVVILSNYFSSLYPRTGKKAMSYCKLARSAPIIYLLSMSWVRLDLVKHLVLDF